MSLLSIRNLGKAYRTYHSEWQRFAGWFGLPIKPSEEHWVLRHVNFDIQPGEAIGIVGQNGAGKSTLLKMITGTLQPTEGQVLANGRIAAILELGMGFNTELTGRQNVFHSAGLMGFSAEQIQLAMPNIEAFAEIGEYFDEPVRTYSSGMHARISFAVATAFRPDILIVDEALSVGDAYFQAKCYERINSFKQNGTTLILVTHSIGDIVKHCDRALYIRNGQIKLDSSTRDVTNLYIDDLFSNNKQKPDDQNISETIDDVSAVMIGSKDIFHTHPGYRKEEHRWGDGGAQILDFLVRADNQNYPTVIMSNSTVEFYYKVIFQNDYDDITAGILLKTHDGVFLYGTNSFLASEGKKIISVQKGKIIVFKFEVPMTLNAGHYMISFGVSTGPQELLIPLDRRYDSVLLTVERPMAFWGLVDLQSTFGMTEDIANVT